MASGTFLQIYYLYYSILTTLEEFELATGCCQNTFYWK